MVAPDDRDISGQFSPAMEPVHVILGQLKEQFDLLQSRIAVPVLQVREKINSSCADLDPTLLIIYTTGTLLILHCLYRFLFQEESLKSRAKKSFFKTLKKLPIIGPAIQNELNKTLGSIKQSLREQMKGKAFVERLPSQGMSVQQVLGLTEDYHDLVTIKAQDGKVSGAVYALQDESYKFMVSQIYARHSHSNPLHMDIFTDVRKMESEVIRMVLTMFHGGQETCGSLASGGTESILLACKAYRNMAYERGIKNPEMIVATSAHAAFDKAAACFKIRLVRVPVNAKTFAIRPKDVKSKITSRTCMIAVSAPSFPHGIIEPVEEIAALGLKYGVPVHVDCCLGGFILPFMDKAGFHDIPPFDFRVPGVTSISCDTHKYGYAPKGSSIIMYSENRYRDHQFDVIPDWVGGIYATPTFAGSRAGANAAVCWATLMHIGEQGYIDRTRRIVNTARYIRDQLSDMDHIFIFGEPKATVIAFGSLDFNIFRLYDAMCAKGWHLNALQFPGAFHLCVTLPVAETGGGEKFVKDMRECVQAVMADPDAKCGGMGALYGMAQSIPDRRMVHEICNTFLATCLDTSNESDKTNGFAH